MLQSYCISVVEVLKLLNMYSIWLLHNSSQWQWVLHNINRAKSHDAAESMNIRKSEKIIYHNNICDIKKAEIKKDNISG